MNSKVSRFTTRIFVLVFAFAAILVAGCPDYSHQRPVPDYKNMTDGGEVEAEPE